MNDDFNLDDTSSLYFTADFTLKENYESTPIFPPKSQSKLANQKEANQRDLSLDSQTETLIESFKRAHEEDYAAFNYQLYSEFTCFVDSTETEAFKKLNNLIKNAQISFLTYDSAIEKIFDDIDFESQLEDLLKQFACFSVRSDLHLRPEVLFIEHSFCLIKFSKFNNMIRSYDELFRHFFTKLDQLAQSSPDQNIQLVASLFINLFNLDLNGMIDIYKLITSGNSRWNVLKNLVYFSFKFALFHMFDLNDKIAKSSIGVILISIYQYIKNFNQI